MLYSKKGVFLIGILACLISQIAAGNIKRSHQKRGLSQQEQIDATYNQQMLEYEKFLKEQQTQLELAKAEQLRQLQEAQVQLFRQQQEQESFIANYQAGLNNEKVHQMNMNKPAGQSVAELKASMPEIAPDAALGGANSNSRRKIEHNEKINDQLRFEESKRQILAQQQLQVDAMNQQHQIQAETRADQQDAFITTKLEEEHMLAKQRDQLYDLIETEVRSRMKKSGSEEEVGEARSQTAGEPVEDLLQAKFARLLEAEKRNKAFEETIAKRKEKYLLIEQERQLRRKEEQIRQAQKLQDILHDSQATQEDYEKRYQDQLEEAKQEQLRQSKVIQEQLHQTQRQLEAQEENMFGVQVLEAQEKAELSGDQQTRNQKLIIMKQQEQVRLAHKMQQNHRLTQDQDHENTKSEIALQQAKQSDHLDSQHFIQHNERVRQKIALESLRNQLKSQISQFKAATEPKLEQPEAVVNPETVYLEPRFFLTETNQQAADEPAKKMDKLPVSKTVTIVETKEEISKPEVLKERKLEITTVVNKTVEVNCNDKEDGMYRNENDCNAYYVCTNKQIYQFACPSGTSFSMEHCTCNWPTESTECVTPLVDNRCDKPAAEPKQEVISSEESYIEDQLMSFSCKNKEKGFYRDPVDCTKFYYCEVFNKPAPLIGQTIIKNDFYCPNNFHFDVFTCKCGEQTANSCSNIALTTYCTHSS